MKELNSNVRNSLAQIPSLDYNGEICATAEDGKSLK